MKLSRSILLLAVLLLAGAVAAQTINAPITGTVTLPDGTKVPFTGTGTLTLPQPPPPPPPPAPAVFALSDASLSWGSAPLPPTSTETVRLLVVTNEGTGSGALTVNLPTGDPAFTLKGSPGAITLKPQATAILAYGYKPTSLGVKTATATLTSAAGTLSVPLSGTVTAAPPPGPLPPTAPPHLAGAGTFGPREALGPGVPLTAAESRAFASRVTVVGFTAAGIQAAMNQAQTAGISTVYLPAGTYNLETAVNVPAGVTLLGAGPATVIRSPKSEGTQFFVNGDGVRFTRLKLSGWTTTWTNSNTQPAGTYNNTRGIWADGRQNLRVDHADIGGFAIALYLSGTVAVVDHCSLHDNPVVGLGYGVDITRGSYVRVADSEGSDSRVLISSGDNPTPTMRFGHWEFVHNRVFSGANWNRDQQGQVSAHPLYNGEFLIAGNRFEWTIVPSIEIRGATGRIADNEFVSVGTAIMIKAGNQDGITGTPHDITVLGSVWSGNAPVTKYYLDTTPARITINGVSVTRGVAAPGGKKPGGKKR